MSNEKRYSVWNKVKSAIAVGPEYRTWPAAKQEVDAWRQDGCHGWRIWDHATTPPTDVTDADPEAEDNGTITTTWWAVGDRFNGPNDMYWEESREAAVASTFAYGRGDSRAYKVDVTATVISDPSAEPEQPRWWYWDKEQGWVFSFESEPRIEIEKDKLKSAVVYGTSETRGKKVDDMFDAMMEAGKP